MKISYIIPHKNRNGLLENHLKTLGKSVFSDYEVIVVDDGSETAPETAVRNEWWAGAGGARSYGASLATGDILMFVGDDCIPSEDLMLWHWYTHRMNPDADVVQGYTMFHPSVTGTYFMDFLDRSGLQANWNSMKNEDGSWKRDVPGFFLTTNVSIKRESWERAGNFSDRFHHAAWEDVEYGVRLQRNHFKTIFQPSAVNFHFHPYNYYTFAKRQRLEGRERLNICLDHPEMSAGLVPPQALRDVAEASEIEVLNNGSDIANIAIPKLREVQESIWAEGLQIMSLLGLREAIIERGGLFNVFLHLHTPEEVTIAFGAIKAIEMGDMGYANHCKIWMTDKNPSNWAIMAFCAEIDLICNDVESAKYNIQRAKEIAPNEKWVRELVERI
jgi:glycosyltransferase involved in cell wall biosynthesis